MGALSLVICLVMLLQIPAGAAQTSLNYGKGLSSDVTLSASKLYEAMYGAGLSAAEKKALDALTEISLTHARIPDSVIDREYDADSGVLKILVEPYEYVAQNGETVLWIPKAVTFNGATKKTLQKGTDGVYFCTFSGLTQSQTFTLDVDFDWQVNIPVEIAGTLVTLPYTVGKDAYDRLKPYEDYQTQQQAYENYLEAKKQYPIDLAAYESYLKAKAAYDEKKALYDSYVAAKTQYEADVKAYNDNEAKKKAYAEAEEAYYAYEKLREQNAALYDKYETFLSKMEVINDALAILDSAYIHVMADVPWGYYLSIKGPTATSFLDTLQGQEHLTGINRSLLDEARAASQSLKNLLIEYEKVSNASYGSKFERTMAKYAYYRAHYDELCRSLKTFYLDMEAIYCTKGIPGLVAMKGKTVQMQIMIAQSYALYAAFNDSVTMDTNWTLEGRLLNDILYKEHRLTDSNRADPTTVEIPQAEVVLPDSLPDPVAHPGEPNYEENMAVPKIEWTGAIPSDPGKAPVAVKNPGSEPVAVEPPVGECPPNPMLSDIESALAKEYKAGTLKKRQDVQTDQRVTLHQRVTCKRSLENIKTVTFYGFDGEKLGEISVHWGQSLGLFRDQIPSHKKDGDERNSEYWFLGWVHFGTVNPSESDYLDLTTLRVTKDLNITPHYQTEPRLYKVVWKIPGKTPVTQTYSYGQTHQCPFTADDVKREPDGDITFEFIGWESQTSGYTVTYTATYKVPVYTVTWIVGEQTYYTKVPYGETADDSEIPKGIPADDYTYVFERWDRSFEPLKGDVTYKAIHTPSSRPLASNGDGSVCEAEHTDAAVILKPTDPMVRFKSAAEYALELDRQLEVAWENFSVTFTAEQLQTLGQGGCVNLRLRKTAGLYAGTVYYQIEFLDQIGRPLNFDLSVLASVGCPKDDGVVGTVYSQTDGTLTEMEAERYVGRLLLTVDADQQIVYRTEYVMSYTDPTQNSQLTALPPRAAEGDTVDLNVKCGYGYEVVGAVLTYADGRTETVTGTSFVMPAALRSVELKVEKIAFEITFVADGAVYHTVKLFFGDKLELPDAPTKAEDGQYTYSFAGWSPEVWNSAVYLEQRAPVFEAVFTAHEKSVTAAEEYQGSFLTRIILIGVGGVLLAVGLILSIIHRRRLIPWTKRVVRGFVPFVKNVFKGGKKPQTEEIVSESQDDPTE